MILLDIVRLLFIYAVAITVHEFSHAWMAHKLGDPTAQQSGRLTLNPLAHIDPFTTLALPFFLILVGSPIIFGAARPVPFAPHLVRGGKRGAALVALAGPLSNFLLAIAMGLVLRLLPGLASLGNSLLVSFIAINIALAVFNLLPIPPLDGSRIIYAFVPDKVADAMDRFEQTGPIALLVIFLVLFPFIGPHLGTVVMTVTNWLLSGN